MFLAREGLAAVFLIRRPERKSRNGQQVGDEHQTDAKSIPEDLPGVLSLAPHEYTKWTGELARCQKTDSTLKQ